MKRIGLTCLAGLFAVGLLTGGLRIVENYVVMQEHAYSELPAHPRYVRALAFDSTVKTPAYTVNGSTWRRVANAKGGTGATIASGAWNFDGGSITLADTFSAAPACICGLTNYDGGTAQSVPCLSTTTTLTPQITGGATLGNELIHYVCVGSLP
jgi:hypothetical protein